MKHTVFVCIAILMMVVAGCFTTETQTPEFTLSAMLQGNWLVKTVDASEEWTTVGTLAINGNSYRFDPAPGVDISSWAQDRFCFFGQPIGEVVFEYEADVSPDDDVRAFEDNDILLRAGIGCGETFLIRVDQDAQELYLHAQFSEMQLYRICKSYGG